MPSLPFDKPVLSEVDGLRANGADIAEVEKISVHAEIVEA